MHLNLPTLANFILSKLDPRSALIGTEFDEDETFTLRLALSRGCEPAARAIWASRLFASRHALITARFIKLEPKWAPWFLEQQATRDIVAAMSRRERAEFIKIINDIPGQAA